MVVLEVMRPIMEAEFCTRHFLQNRRIVCSFAKYIRKKFIYREIIFWLYRYYKISLFLLYFFRDLPLAPSSPIKSSHGFDQSKSSYGTVAGNGNHNNNNNTRDIILEPQTLSQYVNKLWTYVLSCFNRPTKLGVFLWKKILPNLSTN